MTWTIGGAVSSETTRDWLTIPIPDPTALAREWAERLRVPLAHSDHCLVVATVRNLVCEVLETAGRYGTAADLEQRLNYIRQILEESNPK